MEGQIKQYSIAKDFTTYPGPRFKSQGEASGQKFFEEVLDRLFETCVDNKMVLEVNLDGTAGYASSFLDEAFGNLVLKYGKEKVMNSIKIVSDLEPDWINMIYEETIPEWEQKRIEKK